MSLSNAILLFLVAIVGGTLNSVAGGGSFFTFPALTFTGVLSIQANATSTVALWPGSVASIGAYRRELAGLDRVLVITLVIASLVGGVLGAILLLRTPQSIFNVVLPYLLLIATLLFTFGGTITKTLRNRKMQRLKDAQKLERDPDPGLAAVRFHYVAIALAQFVIAAYGGYFGGGIGILMLATLGIMGMENIHGMNALKTVLASCINGVAVITFVLAQAVYWPQALVMIVGAVIGGYGGAYFARKIEQKWVRIFVIVVGFAMTLLFFVQEFAPHWIVLLSPLVL
ncbi:UPF0721 transmembrane protein [Ktedonobacteria bacterium brp13]|nr:UPF0721 transmembrane protein [Ktedonobacteria bacterium brp13]